MLDDAGLAQTPFSTFITSPPHSLSPSLASLVLSLVLAPSSSSPTLACLVRLRQTILSIGKFGNSPFLIGQYGGAGEWVGGFARAAAVKGAVQVVGREVEVEKEEGNEEGKWRVKLSDRHAEGRDDDLEFTVGKIIASSEYLDLFPHLQPSPSSSSTSPRLARALVVLSGSIDLLAAAAAPSEPAEADPDAQPAEEEPTVVPPENVLVVFPSKSLAQEQENPVTALLLGEGAMACPSGERGIPLLAAHEPKTDNPYGLSRRAMSLGDRLVQLRTGTTAQAGPLGFTLLRLRVPPLLPLLLPPPTFSFLTLTLTFHQPFLKLGRRGLVGGAVVDAGGRGGLDGLERQGGPSGGGGGEKGDGGRAGVGEGGDGGAGAGGRGVKSFQARMHDCCVDQDAHSLRRVAGVSDVGGAAAWETDAPQR